MILLLHHFWEEKDGKNYHMDVAYVLLGIYSGLGVNQMLILINYSFGKK
jgi:TPP-dependent trihydroxycyclohexane-1,2-dione (THcHDO) dehydratase